MVKQVGVLVGAVLLVGIAVVWPLTQRGDAAEATTVGTVNAGLLESAGFRLEVSPDGAESDAISEARATEVALNNLPVGSTIVDAGLVRWRNLGTGPGPAADGQLAWVVQVEEPGNSIGAGTSGSILDAGKPQLVYADKFRIEVIDAITGEWLFGYGRAK